VARADEDLGGRGAGDEDGLWCDECEKLVAEDEVTTDGQCPTCGTELIEERRPIPWYFKFMGVATVVYLGWRAYQGIAWIAHHA
jgi:DNA-directed RNA polymerase subunit RPC12/RpoP